MKTKIEVIRDKFASLEKELEECYNEVKLIDHLEEQTDYNITVNPIPIDMDVINEILDSKEKVYDMWSDIEAFLYERN